MTIEQIKRSPDIDTDKPVSRQHERVHLGYYGYPNYWGQAGTWGLGLYPALLAGSTPLDASPAAATEQDGDAHLRSADELRGYHIHGSDGHADEAQPENRVVTR
ncbi:MAG: hypothetical protein ABI664_14605 [bacterium]